MQQHGQLIVDQADSGNEAIQRMTNGEKFCFIISAYDMPNGCGLDLQKYLVQTEARSLFLFFSSQNIIMPYAAHQFCLGVVHKSDPAKLMREVVFGICTSPHLHHKLRPQPDAKSHNDTEYE